MKKNTTITIIVLLLIIAIGIYYFTRPQVQLTSQTANSNVQSSSTLLTYTNTVYGYALNYPQDEKVDYIAENATIPVTQSDDITVYKTGEPTEFGVTAYINQTGTISNAVTEHNSLVALPLQQFAEAIRQGQMNNSSTPDKQVGQLIQITFAGKQAYSFTLTKTFDNGLSGGYILQPDNAVFNFIFVNNNNGQKLMIRYPLNDAIADQIKESFQFLGQ